jgi:tRNA pseudouridine38-40 synthase
VERRVRIDLAYDGTAYAGWQLQKNALSVQETVEGALASLHGGLGIRVRGAGRTDSGAHALGQVADAAVATRCDDPALFRALCRLLPADVRPRRVLTVPEDFDARRHARAKTYRYLIDRTPGGDPWRRRFALAWPHAFDERAVGDALARLTGTHDWSGFTGSACVVKNRRRTMSEARLETARPGLSSFVFTADGFLTHMVRNIVGTLLAVGRGGMPPERIDAILAARDRTMAGPTAPAHGLCLARVAYDDAVGGASGDDLALW